MSGASVTMAAGAARPEIRTSLLGLLRGELRKIIHLRIAWVMAAVMTVLVIGGQLLLISGPRNAANMASAPLNSYYNVLQGDIAIVRILSGVFILILAAHVVGLEYQHGTIRVLLARGVGRLRLLGAKVAALALVGLLALVVESLIELAFAWGLSLALAHGGQPWRALGATFWANLRIYLLYLALNLIVTMLLAVAASVLGRSLAFGLAVGLSWFAVDNMLIIPLSLLERLTGSDFWARLSTVLLGPLLNRLPDDITLPDHAGSHAIAVGGFGAQPLLHVSGAQALLVIGAYSALFIATAVILTWRRDVLE
ncbi:MAG: ABC transporter permease [Chloroflexota bacterium]|nr:ABC transporter permease [Chloroflexota bacterium]